MFYLLPRTYCFVAVVAAGGVHQFFYEHLVNVQTNLKPTEEDFKIQTKSQKSKSADFAQKSSDSMSKAPWLTSHHTNNSGHSSSNSPRAFSSDWNSYENRNIGQQRRSFGNNGGLTSQAPSAANLKNSDRNIVCSPALQKFRGACKNNPEPTVTIPDDINGATLNNLQARVVASVLSGYSTFFSGPAGSGKSFILDRYDFSFQNIELFEIVVYYIRSMHTFH